MFTRVQISNDQKVQWLWPNWSQGVPTKLRKGTYTFPPMQSYCETLELRWNGEYPLSLLRDDYSRLPGNYQNELSGVYRIFARGMIIDRCCGQDPTGTLYIGQAGSGNCRSTLRRRIRSIAKRQHHAFDNWRFFVEDKFPWESLAVDWAYTGAILDSMGNSVLNSIGDSVPEAPRAESWLLECYNHSFGEFPPWNQKR
jgi:hypothetical protein